MEILDLIDNQGLALIHLDNILEIANTLLYDINGEDKDIIRQSINQLITLVECGKNYSQQLEKARNDIFHVCNNQEKIKKYPSVADWLKGQIIE